MSHTAINNLVIVGGTHGNEWSGTFLLRRWRQHPEQIRRDSFNIETLLANPEACRRNVRYVEKDLNRCFNQSQLQDYELLSREDDRAKVINMEIGPKGRAQTDFILDLHTSTANMGINLVLTKLDAFHAQLAVYLHLKLENVAVTLEDRGGDDHHFLCSIADKHAIIEVGPVAQGTLNHSVIQQTEQATQCVLDFIEAYNRQQLPPLPESFSCYRYLEPIVYPTTPQGEPTAVIHHSLQGQDFCMIHDGDPLFENLDGEVIHYQGEPTYISFVNEAAYYDQHIALFRLQQFEVMLEDYQD